MYRCTHTHAQDCVHHCTYTRTLTQTRQGEMTHETLGVQTFTDVGNGIRCRLEFGNPCGRKGLPSDYFEGAIERCVYVCACVCVCVCVCVCCVCVCVCVSVCANGQRRCSHCLCARALPVRTGSVYPDILI